MKGRSVTNEHGSVKISIAATNPCHVWALAVQLDALKGLGRYYSGYPAWKLAAPHSLPVRCHSWRTVVTYALHGKIPERFRVSNSTLFRWQDAGFDRWVAKVLESNDFHHGIPGQCVRAFRRARELGIKTVLNHATGPAHLVAEILQPEYDRVGLKVHADGGYERGYLEQVKEEFVLSDYHCCASSVVRDQLVQVGVDPARVWVIPYGADSTVWNAGKRQRARSKDEPFRIIFAGQVSLRKGLRFLLDALQQAGNKQWHLDVYGPLLDETQGDRDAYVGSIPIIYHGAVDQAALAEAMRQSDLLVLPSLEEGFGLVVVQALACGLPCAVSSMVGAKDLITEGVDGSVFPVSDVGAIQEVLAFWERSPRRVEGEWGWEKPARTLLELSREALAMGDDGRTMGGHP
jgi:glycosyltransferase involved in cell wall biosynthesis